MSGYIRGADRRQAVLFPETTDEYVGLEKLVRFIHTLVDTLYLAKMRFTHAERA